MEPLRPGDHGIPASDPFRVGAQGARGRGRAVFRSARFDRPTRGVRIRASVPANVQVRAAAALLVLPELAAISGPTAARLLRLPVPDGVDEGGRHIHVAVPPRTVVRRAGVRAHAVWLGVDDVTRVGGSRVTTPARTLADLAAVLSLPDLVAVGDAILRGGLATRGDLSGQVRSGRRGVRRLRRALLLLDPRAESPQESRLRVHIIEAGLPTPVPNQAIVDEWGGFVARGDLVYPQWRVVVEYDGAHHARYGQRVADADRRTRLRQHGWFVVEITADDLIHPWKAVAKVRSALRSCGAPV